MKAAEYFKHYPGHDECYVTADGNFFHTAHDAAAHAHNLSEREVTHLLREDAASAGGDTINEEDLRAAAAGGEDDKTASTARKTKGKK